MAYSEDYRRRAIEYIDEGHTYAELYEALKLHPSRIAEWRKLLAESGSLKPQYKKSRKSKIDMEKLAEALERKPDAYLDELAKPFECKPQAVHYALKKVKVTVKKNNTPTRKNQR